MAKGYDKKNFNKEEYAEKKANEIKEIVNGIEAGIKDFMTSEKFTNYLSIMSKFHKYSFNNSLLIAMQKPEASLVAGFGTWKTQGRTVSKGEKGITILAPTPYKVKSEVEVVNAKTGKKETEEKEIKIMSFKKVSVFDISQTEGKEIPTICNELKGDVRELNAVKEAIEEVTTIKIEYEDIKGNAKGYFSPLENRIAIQKGMEELQQCKTIVHEGAHAMLHADMSTKIDRHKAETEAEATAFVVCKRLGLDTSNYSFPYLASWASSAELLDLKQSLKIIQQTSMAIIDKVEEKLKVLDLDKGKEPIKKEGSVIILESNHPFIFKGDVVKLENSDEAFNFINDNAIKENNKERNYEIKFAIKMGNGEIKPVLQSFCPGEESGGLKQFLYNYLSDSSLNEIYGTEPINERCIIINDISKKNCIEIISSNHNNFVKGDVIKFFEADDKFIDANKQASNNKDFKEVRFNGYDGTGKKVISNKEYKVGCEVGGLAGFVQKNYHPRIFKSLYSENKMTLSEQINSVNKENKTSSVNQNKSKNKEIGRVM